jgi:hypothetical protein
VSTHRWLHLLGALPVALRRRRHRPPLCLAGLWLLLAGLALLAGPVARGAVTNLDAALPALGRPPGLPPTYLGDLSERPSLGSW